MPKGFSAIQRDLKSLEQTADRNLMEFSTGKYEVLHPVRNKLHSTCWGVVLAAPVYSGGWLDGRQLFRRGPGIPDG